MALIYVSKTGKQEKIKTFSKTCFAVRTGCEAKIIRDFFCLLLNKIPVLLFCARQVLFLHQTTCYRLGIDKVCLI